MKPSGFCNNCGRGVEALDARCPACGFRPAGQSDEPVTAAVPAIGVRGQRARRERARTRAFDVIRGRNAGARFLLGERHVIGRAPDVDIFLDDHTVSRHHAEVSEREAGTLWLRDLGSTNGTYLNGQLVEDHAMVDGDLVQIGVFKLLFDAGA